jgi:hypothetical protein
MDGYGKDRRTTIPARGRRTGRERGQRSFGVSTWRDQLDESSSMSMKGPDSFWTRSSAQLSPCGEACLQSRAPHR